MVVPAIFPSVFYSLVRSIFTLKQFWSHCQEWKRVWVDSYAFFLTQQLLFYGYGTPSYPPNLVYESKQLSMFWNYLILWFLSVEKCTKYYTMSLSHNAETNICILDQESIFDDLIMYLSMAVISTCCFY